MKENMKNQIIDVDGYVHIVNGKVICFESDVYDLDNPEDVKELLELSARMRSNDEDDKFYYRAYGDDTILFVDKSHFCKNSVYMEAGDFFGLPENYRKRIEEVLNEIK